MTVQCGLVAESIRLRHNSFRLRITSTHWSSGNPNDFEGNEDCIDIFVTADECNDRSCDYYTPFICEFFFDGVHIQRTYKNIVHVVLYLSTDHS